MRERRLSSPQDQWRKASATEILEADGLMIDGVNGFIDPDKAVGKLKNHGRGLGVMQALVAFIMSIVAVITGEENFVAILTHSRSRLRSWPSGMMTVM